jgi:MFS family permease
MNLSVEKALQVCGNNNRYQKLFYIAVALTWFSVDFISLSFPLLELMPNFTCRQQSGEWIECNEDTICKLPKEDFKTEVTYENILTDFNLECEKTFVILIGVIYTLGVVLGSFLASKFSDVLGRKPVLLICHFLFAFGALGMTFAPKIEILLGLLFFVGLSCAGGVLVSYLYISEVLAPGKRSIYGTLINASFSIAGIVYFLLFSYLKNWKYLAYLCVVTDIISGLLILSYFTESPRYLLAKGDYNKALKSLEKIAIKNGRRKDFIKYLESDIAMDLEKSDTEGDLTRIEESNSCKLNSEKSLPELGIDNSTQNINNTNFTQNYSEKSTLNETPKDSPFISQKSIDKYVKDINKEDNIIKQELIPKPRQERKEAPFKSLLKYKSLRANFLVCCFLWFAMAFTYYGISMGLKQNKKEIFTSGYVVYGAEGISYMITGIMISTAFFGRVGSIKIMMFIAAASTCAYFFVRKFEMELYDNICLFLARFGITGIYSIMYTYSTEIYPTTIRAKGLGVNTLFARFAAILVPIVVELFNPFLMYTTVCLIAFLLSFFLPETYGKEMEDEILEERFRQKIYVEN